jgi:hypothetical protein
MLNWPRWNFSLDRDWLRFKGSFMWASGDDKPFDDKARGFDSILDHVEFAGSKFSYFNSQGFLFSTRRAVDDAGQPVAQFAQQQDAGPIELRQPGIFVYNLGVEAELKPKLRAI